MRFASGPGRTAQCAHGLRPRGPTTRCRSARRRAGPRIDDADIFEPRIVSHRDADFAASSGRCGTDIVHRRDERVRCIKTPPRCAHPVVRFVRRMRIIEEMAAHRLDGYRRAVRAVFECAMHEHTVRLKVQLRLLLGSRLEQSPAVVVQVVDGARRHRIESFAHVVSSLDPERTDAPLFGSEPERVEKVGMRRDEGAQNYPLFPNDEQSEVDALLRNLERSDIRVRSRPTLDHRDELECMRGRAVRPTSPELSALREIFEGKRRIGHVRNGFRGGLPPGVASWVRAAQAASIETKNPKAKGRCICGECLRPAAAGRRAVSGPCAKSTSACTVALACR